MPDSRDGERRQKSWRDIDRKKDRSSHRRDEAPAGKKGRGQKREQSGAYQTYKKDLDRVFSGGGIPDYLKEQLPEQSEADQARLKLLGAIERAANDHDLNEAVAAYLKKYDDFPEDQDLLLKVLDYPEESVKLQAARMLDAIWKVNPISHKRQFALKLDSIAMLADDDDLQELAEELVGRLR